MKRFLNYLLPLLLVFGSGNLLAAKLTDQPVLAVPAANDIMHVVDVSDTTSDPAGTSKQATLTNITAPFLANTTALINVFADLPTPVAGVISLVANTNYVLGDNVSVGTNRVDVSAGGISWTSGNQFGPTLTYTGTGTMFTGVDVTFHIFEAQIDAPNGTVFNGSNVATPGVNLWLVSAVRISNCTKIGTFTSLQAIVIENSNAANCNNGVTLVGPSWSLQSFVKFAIISTSATLTGIDIGTSVTSSGEIANLVVVAPAGAVGVSGAANSANILPGGLFTFRDSNFFGGMTAEISGITTDDIRWAFELNSGLSDTKAVALLNFKGNSTLTDITGSSSDASNAVLVAGTWTCTKQSLFSCTTAGRVTFNGERTLPVSVDVIATMDTASADTVAIYLAKNGTPIVATGISQLLEAADEGTLSTLWDLDLDTTDFLEIVVENQTDATDITVIDIIFRVRQ